MQFDHHHQHRPSRKDKKTIQVRKAIGVFVALFLVAAGIGYAYISTHKDTRPIDPATFCPTDDKGPASVTAILIDRTDSFNLTQQAAIRDRLNDIKDNTPKYGLIEIYSVEPTKTKLLHPDFAMCNPGRGEDVSDWTGNPRLLEERWKDFFDAPLQNLFNSVLSTQAADVSPIMESIQSIEVTDLGTQKLISKKIPRRLIIVSDLIQYVKDYSQYHAYSSFGQFSTTPYYESVRSDLSNIPIEIWYVRRKNTLSIQNDKHIDFWRDYLTNQGGNVDKVWYVPGI